MSLFRDISLRRIFKPRTGVFCAWATIGIILAPLAGCETPNDNLITNSRFTPAPRQYKTADAPGRYAASCSNDRWAATSDGANPIDDLLSAEARHSTGDILQVTVLEGAEFTGNYVINLDGQLVLPYAGSIRAAGLTTTQLQEAVRRKLTSTEMFQERGVRVAVLPVQWAAIQVSIDGAVYQPGTDYVNEPSEKPQQNTLMQKTGDSPLGRFLREAFRLGNGVRPDADLSSVSLTRDGKSYPLDLSGAINGRPVPLIPLMSGDIINVPSSGCFHQALFRPSQVTPPGIRVFMSNLTQTATNNTEAAIGQFSENLPYGTRLLEGSVSANCVGGTVSVNAERRIVLISRNTLDRKTEVIERTVSDLMAKPDDPDNDPYLMPNDAIACYDSEFSNARDVARGITEIMTAVMLLKLL
jgi:polysaccharide biosynthesis/export protein